MLSDTKGLGVLSYKAILSSSPGCSSSCGMQGQMMLLWQAYAWVPNEGSWACAGRLCCAHQWKKWKELSELSWSPLPSVGLAHLPCCGPGSSLNTNPCCSASSVSWGPSVPNCLQLIASVYSPTWLGCKTILKFKLRRQT